MFTIYNLNMLSSIVSVAILALAALPSSLAAPAISVGKGKFFQCPVTTAPVLPAGQTSIVFDASIPTQFVALGVGACCWVSLLTVNRYLTFNFYF